MAEVDADLLAHPLAHPNFHGSVLVRHKRAKGQAGRCRRLIGFVFDHAALQLIIAHPHNRGADIDQNAMRI
jgi:hypothetical protein